MKLVEVVRGVNTSDETVNLTAALVKGINKTPVILKKEIPGFIVTRIVRAIKNEAFFLLEQGVASFQDIDVACELGLNHPMGPFKLADLSGLDIQYNSMMEVYKQTNDPKDLPPKSLRERVERGGLGKKSGKGFYDYG